SQSFLDKFKFSATDVGKITKVKIGHDHIKSNTSWTLGSLRLKTTANSRLVYVFDVNKSFDRNSGDRLIERDLTPTTILKESPEKSTNQKLNSHDQKHNKNKKNSNSNKNNDKNDKDDDGSDDGGDDEDEAKYIVTTTTGNKFGSGTDSKIFVQLFGKDGERSDRILLQKSNNKNPFERGKVDTFEVFAPLIRKIEKVKIGHDSSKLASGWFLEELKVSCQSTGDVYGFKVGRWFDEKEEDGKINYLFFTASSKPSKDKSPEKKAKRKKADDKDKYERVNYDIETVTGTDFGSGTDSKVFIQLFGVKGRTSKMFLDKTVSVSDNKKDNKNDNNRNNNNKKGNSNLFETGQTDHFTVSSLNIGKIKKVRIGHDGTKLGSGWYLSRLKVTTPANRAYLFSVGKWLDEEDSKNEIYIFPDGAKSKNETETNNSKSRKNNGNNKKKKTAKSSSPAKTGSKNKPTKHGKIDNDGEEEEEEENDNDTGNKHNHDHHHHHHHEDRTKDREKKSDSDDDDDDEKNKNHSSDSTTTTTTYTISVKTGNKFGAGTDSEVYVALHGKSRTTDRLILKKSLSKSKNPFERNSLDVFQMDAVDVGKITIGHNGTKFGSGWFLDHVTVERSNQVFMFNVDRWLDKREDDGKIEREIDATTIEVVIWAAPYAFIFDALMNPRASAGEQERMNWKTNEVILKRVWLVCVKCAEERKLDLPEFCITKCGHFDCEKRSNVANRPNDVIANFDGRRSVSFES
ncbi:hypothetical protein HELRODRAFT_181307, partial [Helobdella robusta]|uniref:PLAT domain-containing protein n=1 Tax=Helobdella robusta TaxID=6412 RepID=T1FGV7_HELRO